MNLKDLTGRIELWILLFFIIRLFHITYPPLETAHSWRQSDVLMVARNFYENSANILYPRVDYGGNSSGIIGMEFPLLNYIIYLISTIFGYNHYYGRIINLIVSSLGAYYFYKILKAHFSEGIAFYATISLLSSLWFVYSRKAMPDIFSTSLVLVGIYHGLRFLYRSDKWIDLIVYAVFITLGILSKISSGYLMVILLVPLVNNRIRLNIRIQLALVSAVSLSLVVSWYFIWVPYLSSLSKLGSFFMGVSFSQGIKELSMNINGTLEKFYFNAMGFSGCIIFLTGIYFAIKRNNKIVLYILGSLSLAFIIFMLKMGRNFWIDSYYILVFIPVIAFVAGMAIHNIKYKWLKILIMIVVFIENTGNHWTDFFPRKERMELVRLEEIMDIHTGPNDLIAINTIDPTGLYMAHRKGWKLKNYQIQDDRYMNKLKKEGCKYLVLLNNEQSWHPELNYRVLFEDKYFTLYQL